MLLILLAYRVFHFPELFLDFGNKLIQSTLEKKKKKDGTISKTVSITSSSLPLSSL